MIHYARNYRARRTFGQWLDDSATAFGAYGVVLAGVVFAVLPIWV